MSIIDWIFEKTGIAINDNQVSDRTVLLYAVGLLVKVGQADGDFSPEEAGKIIDIIKSYSMILDQESIKFLQESFQKTQTLSEQELLSKLNQELKLSQKQQLLEMAYLVLHADQSPEVKEKKFISKICAGLELPENIRADAYLAAKDALQAPKK